MCRNHLCDLCLYAFCFFVFAFPFSPFLIFLQQWLTFYWACFQFWIFWESIYFIFRGVWKCSWRKSCCKFFTQISGHFCAYVRLHWANHSDLGITGKIVSSCRTILVQGDDIRGGTKANACHRQFTAGTGVSGLKVMQNSMDWIEVDIVLVHTHSVDHWSI